MNHETIRPRDPEPSRRSQIFEVSVFILLVLPSMVISHFAVKQPGFGFTIAAVGTILHNVAFLSLIAFFAWKNGESWDRFGWTGRNAGRELIVGLWLFALMFLAVGLVESVLSSIGVSRPGKGVPSFLTPRAPAGYVLAFFLVLVASISEEIIFRGYLILRFTAVAGSRVPAVLLSTLIFSAGHGYQGVFGVAAVFAIGLVLSLVYLWRKSLLAPMVMHFLQNFLGIFVLPLLGSGRG